MEVKGKTILKEDEKPMALEKAQVYCLVQLSMNQFHEESNDIWGLSIQS